MEISELKDKLVEKKKLLKDKIYKWKLMRQFGDNCPRCGRKLVSFSLHAECYKKFIMLSHGRKRSRILNKPASCAVCGNAAVKGRRYFCTFCGYYR